MEDLDTSILVISILAFEIKIKVMVPRMAVLLK